MKPGSSLEESFVVAHDYNINYIVISSGVKG